MLILQQIKKCRRRFKGSTVSFSPLFCELALEGVFEDGLAVGFELFARGGQGLDAFVEFGEQFLNLGHDPALLAQRRKCDGGFLEFSLCHMSKPDPTMRLFDEFVEPIVNGEPEVGLSTSRSS